MNIISRIIRFIMGPIMTTKPTLPKPKRIVLGVNDAAIVLRPMGADFIYPSPNAKPPAELMDTLEFLHYAIQRKDWHEEWLADKEAEEALMDMITGYSAPEDEPPRFEIIEGGLADEPREPEKGPFAKK